MKILHVRSQAVDDFDAPLALAATGHEVVSTNELPGDVYYGYDLFILDVLQDGKDWEELARSLYGCARLESPRWQALIVIFSDDPYDDEQLENIRRTFRVHDGADCLPRSSPILKIREAIQGVVDLFSAA